MEPAIVFDRTVFWFFNPGNLREDALVYGYEGFLKGIERHILEATKKACVETGVNFPEINKEASRKEKIDFVRRVLDKGVLPKNFEQEVIRNHLEYLALFDSNRAIVIYKEGEDELAKRFIMYRQALNAVRTFIPKAFLVEFLGKNPDVSLVYLDSLAKKYKKRLRPVMKKGLSNKNAEYLIERMKMIATSYRDSITSRGLREDLNVVATAYCIHHKPTVILSDDGDVDALVRIVNSTLTVGERVKVVKSYSACCAQLFQCAA